MKRALASSLFLGLFLLAIAGCGGSDQKSGVIQDGQDSTRIDLLNLAEKDLQKQQRPELDFGGDSAIPRKYRYIVDTTHSSVQFKVRHWGIYDIVGWIESYDVSVYFTELDFSDAIVVAKLRPASIIMPNRVMAGNLKDPEALRVQIDRPELAVPTGGVLAGHDQKSRPGAF